MRLGTCCWWAPPHGPISLGPGSAPGRLLTPVRSLTLLLTVFHAVVDALAVLAFLGALSGIAFPAGFTADFFLGSHGMRCDLTGS